MTRASNAPLERFLARLLSRSSLSGDEQAAILNLRSRAVQVASHRDIIAPGGMTSSACLVVEGLVARFDQMADGLRQFTSLYIAGDMCDLHSVVSPTAGWGLQAITNTTILRIFHADLRELAVRHPAIAFAFWRQTVVDASILAKWVSNVGRRDARSRLAHLFCELGLRMELAGIGSRTDFPLPMTQSHLADALGLTSVHVNRTLQTMRHDGLVVTENRRVRVGRWSELVHVAEFDPQFLLLPELPNLAA
jgi:CRP-like cAMP-binding protein